VLVIDEGVGAPQAFAEAIARDDVAGLLEKGAEDLGRLFLKADPRAVAVRSPVARSNSNCAKRTRPGPRQVGMARQ
jgi:hypothetical protein